MCTPVAQAKYGYPPLKACRRLLWTELRFRESLKSNAQEMRKVRRMQQVPPVRMKGKGVPMDRGRRGDLLIRVKVEFPQKLSKEAKELLEKLKKEGI